VPELSDSTSAPAALPAPVPVLVSAQPRAGPGVAVGGVDRGGFVAHRHEPQVLADRLDQGQVVHADHAEDRVDACVAQDSDQQVSAGGMGHVGPPQDT
jgi:hypothetical protein